MANAEFKPVGAVAHAVQLLRALAVHARPVSLAVLARETGVNLSTAFNILRTLSHERLVHFDQDAKTYGLAMGVLEFSMPLLGANQAEIIRPELARLAEAHDALFGLWHFARPDRLVLIDKLARPGMVRVEMPLGARLPAGAGSIGRCYAAHLGLSGAALRQAYDTVRWHAAPGFEAYAREAEEAGREGYAVDSGALYAGVETVSALIIDRAGQARFAIAASAILATRTPSEADALGADLRDAARWIGNVLFGAAT